MNKNTEIKPAAVGGESREQLLTWLNENPKTLGWDAVVVYNRGRANALLMQQYIKKLTADNYLTPIDGEIAGADGSNLTFYGIQLGIPRLSFESADIEKSKAKVTQAITAGLAILKSEPVGGYKGIHAIMRPNGAAGPTLWMDVDLVSTPGEVTDAGSVVIDLATMTNFDTDLFSDSVSIINAQKFFLKRFDENPELHTYTLGTLSTLADSTLTPKNFTIRTQAAPGATIRGAANYSDGAVVLFVTLKGGTDGGMPTYNSDFRYLIPNDNNGAKYSSAVVLSNKVLFSKLILPQLNSPPMHYVLETPTDDAGNSLHMYAQATAVDLGISKGLVFNSYWNQGGDRHDSTLTGLEDTILNVKRSGEHTGLRVRALNNTINLNWNVYGKGKWNQKVDVEGGRDTDVDGYIELFGDANSNMTLLVNPTTGVIEFSNGSKASTGIYTGDLMWLEFFGADNRNDLRSWFAKAIDGRFTNWFTYFKLPDIDTFLLRNLLFPDNNAMVLTDAHVPGDLAIFGNVDPSLTSFVITPEQPILLAGATRTFTTEPAVTDVTWRVQALPGDENPFGSIDSNGLYTAPSLEELQGRDAQQVIVTATGTTTRGAAASSSTLVSIVYQTVSVNPMFCVSAPGKTQAFTAGTTDDSVLTWTMKDPGQNGGLEPNAGSTSTYTAGTPENNAKFTLDVIEVTDAKGNFGQAEVLVINGTLGGQVTVDLTEAAEHKVQLQFEIEYDEGPKPVPHNLLHWTLLAGTGWVDEHGFYHAPELEEPGFALITCAFETQPYPGAPKQTLYGYTVLPLPLALYPDLAKAYR